VPEPKVVLRNQVFHEKEPSGSDTKQISFDLFNKGLYAAKIATKGAL